MKLGHSVYPVADGNTKICHADLVISDDRHISNLGLIIRIISSQALTVLLVHDTDDLIDSWQKELKHILVPALQSLGHDRMVRIVKDLAYDVLCFFPSKAFFVHENPH